MKLYRPVGLAELELIAQSGYRAFPPRLPIQPIFYPVLNLEYAVQIAEGWNTTDAASGYAGFVTAFDLDDQFAARYPIQTAGARMHQELWVPAEELEEFNQHIQGGIRIERAFYGPKFAEPIDADTRLPAQIIAAYGAP